MSFTWTDADLNQEQSDAVVDEGNVFLVACPGSGKTRTLTYKIAHELSRIQSPKKFVVAFTYTNRAADEIHERIENLGIDTSQLWIGTIHSFCLEWILKPYGIYAPRLAHGFRIIDVHEQEKLLEEFCRVQGVDVWDCGYYVTEDDYHLSCIDRNKHPRLHAVYARYFQHLADNRILDFEQILQYAWRLLESKPEIARVLSNLFPLILVDEFQDTKRIQYSMLGAILRAGEGRTRIFIVGDPNQAIYGSLGGFAMAAQDFRALCGQPLTERQLSGNYRSSARIVQYFSNYNVFATQIYAASPDSGFPSIVTYNNTVQKDVLIDEVVRLVRQALDAGIAQSEICILAPWWMHLAAMTRRLMAALPHCEFNGPGIVPFSRDIENFWYRLSRIALTQASPSQYTRRMRWAAEVIRDLESEGIDVSSINPKVLLRESNSIHIDERDGLEYLTEYFSQLMERLGIDWRAFPLLASHHAAFFASSLAQLNKVRGEGIDLRDIDFFRKVFKTRSGINVSTIHGVKGAEFDVVIAYALLQGMVPNSKDVDGEVSAKKMLYVVGSRARKHLHLIAETGRRSGRTGPIYRPTEVLARCVFPYNLA
ncbi:ATP-dependent helicase [Herbaspirillum sp. BH-1]|uniref:UvrD-helicase domain-containing protein n=1 Tax=Herbaspirillum sp. (strain BH-1) TaxID=2058884 RepID=UPI000C88265F|nr:ATP-dependent helicase [Herbaspirillum sp. BH-1]PLY57877.1 ATP-dependent helicase [Herbaspirillum sp. BH-1]